MSSKSLSWKSRSGGKSCVLWKGEALIEAHPSTSKTWPSAEGPLSAVPFPCSLQDDALVYETALPASGRGAGAVAELVHRLGPLRQVWIPHLAPYDHSVIGDHSFRSPAVIVADERRVLILIPDLDDLQAVLRAGGNLWMDYDHAARTVRFAAGAFAVGRHHVLYEARPVDYKAQRVRARLHVVVSDKPADLANPYRLASRVLWERWGRAGHEESVTRYAPLGRYSEHIVNWAFTPEPAGWGDIVWHEFDVEGRACGAPTFIVDVAQHPSIPKDKRRWREQKSVWNQAWFSTQRTANGLLRYARQIGSADLERRANLMTQVALAAPQADGLFPAVLTAGGGGALDKDVPGWDQAIWTNSDRRPPGVPGESCHILDAAFTARLLLEWHDLNPAETEALDYARRFADRLCRLQREDGSFPGWVEPNGDHATLLAAGPESAMGASLLLDLAGRFPREAAYRKAAIKALDYLEKGPIPESRWEDFETYFSCSRWGEDRVGQRITRNGVFKSNTFSPFWCAEAFLAAYRLLGKGRYLKTGRRCLDELALYQQVWEPCTIPAPTHGGFGVMNADGEWNDARQSLFAPLFLEYYRETGETDYFERGVSALRSSFAMVYCPENAQVKEAYERQHPFFGPESYGFMMENIAHGGPGPEPIGPFTIYTWGNGAALEAAAKVRDLFGDVYVDVERQKAFGIDGCRARFVGSDVVVETSSRSGALTVVSSTGRRVKTPISGSTAKVSLTELK